MSNVFANVLVLLLIAGFSALSALNPDAFYKNVQEDQPLEWATFWAFIAAAALFGRAAYLRRKGKPLPWFFAGVAAFCIVVAMEEISWGQRVLGYSPPRYFLQNNFQQELNLHNVIATSLRKQLVGVILLGYGLLLPLLRRIPKARGLLVKLGVTPPPGGLAPIFVALFALLVFYPLRYSGEIIEAGLALAFLFASIDALAKVEETEAQPRWLRVAGSLSVVALLAFGSAIGSRGQLAADPIVAEVTATEIRALRRDFERLARDGKLPCGKHERVNWMAKLSRSDTLKKGRFFSLSENGLPDERAEFFIDPWATAYWVRTTCNDQRDKIFLYSFGPNRRRDSNRWKRRGDDIGVIFRVRHDEASGSRVAQQR